MSYGSFATGDYLKATFSGSEALPLTLVSWIKRTAAQWADTSTDFVINVGAGFGSEFNSAAREAGTGEDRVSAIARNADSSGGAQLNFTGGDYDDIWVPVIAAFVATADRDMYI